jgi:SPP1 gp7 family putative phage head morphogenesis protein
MATVSPELRVLDQELREAEQKQESDFDKFIAALLAMLLFQVKLLPDYSWKNVKTLTENPKVRENFRKLYIRYFDEISDIATAYTKQELLKIAQTNFQRKRIENIQPRQKSYNKRYARKLAERQAKDLQESLTSNLKAVLDVEPEIATSGLNNVLRGTLKGYKDIRSSVTAETEANRITNQVRLELFKKSRVIKGFIFTAVLDKRTTQICRSRNGTRLRENTSMLASYTPPLHPRCRSYLVPITIADETPFTPITDVRRIARENPAKPVTKVIRVKR